MAESSIDSAPSEPVHRKRGGKRTARACDECRMRKSKCDGLQPCEACQTTDRYCTYNLSAGRSTSSGTRIRILEDRLRRARAYLNEAQRRTPSLSNINFDALLGSMDEYAHSQTKGQDGSDNEDDQGCLDSMMDSYGQMTVNSSGGRERDFYGAASGLAWIRRARDYFQDAASVGSDESEEGEANHSATVQLFDAPLPPKQTLSTDGPIVQLLPPRETASRLVQVVFAQVYPLFHFIHENDFQASTDKIYSLDPSEYNEAEQAFLPLFNLVIGLGYLFSRDEHDKYGCRQAVAQGMRHFVAARTMLDIAHLRTIVSLQSVIALILFLISTARMGSAYSFLGAACASAMRQGLHYRSAHEISIPDIERRVRRRLFWSIMNLDMYVSNILGLPPFMDLTAVDPAIDATIEHALREAQENESLLIDNRLALEASAKHIELMRIMFKAQMTLFPRPTDPPNAQKKNGTISVSLAKMQEVENQFREWAQSLTDILSNSSDTVEAASIKYEMHLCYYFAQIVLYRPFVHYMAKQSDDEAEGRRQMSYAQTCVRMASKVVEVSIKHQQRGLLCPASWPSVYTVFVSVVCLIFAYATRKHDRSAHDTKQDIENGIRMLACTACTTDTGSVRCLEILRRLLKRVSYAVDVDLDQICADTKPCCASDFTPKGQRTTNLDGPLSSRHTSADLMSSSSDSSWMPPATSSGQMYSFSPDAMMTGPLLDHNAFSNQPAGHSQSYLQHPDETMEIPYVGEFTWQDDQEFAGPSQESVSASSSQHRSGRPSQRGRKLTPEDIAGFMQHNPVDERFRRPPL